MKISVQEANNYADQIQFKPVGRPNKYPFAKLKPGEMITFEALHDETPVAASRRASTALTNWKRRHGATWNSAVRISGNEVRIFRFN